ncbi:unnamed protein product [Hydatigera taeniaeformis]|uniref:Homeobox domain-containing protein n=1 Tax=Hydatigena taeniaeformis TaxID=6205 RepID=A0A0R3X8U3_HYDTA|nr:unnamed protein product [Hydatigera taeniaeformis]
MPPVVLIFQLLRLSVVGQGVSRRQRTMYTAEQLHLLEGLFAVNKYPDLSVRQQLASRLHLAESRIQVWFKNRRAKLRNLQQQQQQQQQHQVQRNQSIFHS